MLNIIIKWFKNIIRNTTLISIILSGYLLDVTILEFRNESNRHYALFSIFITRKHNTGYFIIDILYIGYLVDKMRGVI